MKRFRKPTRLDLIFVAFLVVAAACQGTNGTNSALPGNGSPPPNSSLADQGPSPVDLPSVRLDQASDVDSSAIPISTS